MKNRRIINMLSFGTIVLVAGLFLIRFLGVKIFGWSEQVSFILYSIIVGLLLLVALLSALNFTISRRNSIYNIILFFAIVICVVFFVLMF